jgi:hypothetical protein
MEALGSLAQDLRRDVITLVLARLRKRLRDELDAAGLESAIGAEHFYPSVEQAVASWRPSDQLSLRVDERTA